VEVAADSFTLGFRINDMKILLAIDGSVHSKAAIEEVARRLFPPNT